MPRSQPLNAPMLAHMPTSIGLSPIASDIWLLAVTMMTKNMPGGVMRSEFWAKTRMAAMSEGNRAVTRSHQSFPVAAICARTAWPTNDPVVVPVTRRRPMIAMSFQRYRNGCPSPEMTVKAPAATRSIALS